MDEVESRKFGNGHKELGGGVDLIHKYRLQQYHEFFCKRSLPLSILGSRYLDDVVGNKEIKKGEGMELDQLCQGISIKQRSKSCFAFDVYTFPIRDSNGINLQLVNKGIPDTVGKSANQSEDKGKKRHKDNVQKDEISKKRKLNHKDFGNGMGKIRNVNGSSLMRPPLNQHRKSMKPEKSYQV